MSLLPPNSLYVVSYPRSGNTWLVNCLVTLLGAVRGEAYTPFKLYTELHGDPRDGFHFWCESRRRLDQPICIKSHDRPDLFARRHPPAPAVYIARDPRDALLSFYFFSQAYAGGEELDTRRLAGTSVLISRGQNEPTFDPAAFRDFLLREAPNWAAHVGAARTTPGICYLTYEGLTHDFAGSLEHVVAYLGLRTVESVETADQIYHTGFMGVFAGANRDFFRRGKIGDWRNWYTADHADLINQLVGPQLLEWGFESEPNWPARFRSEAHQVP